jgi:sugar phosphate isomerase/epimerase
MEGVPEFAVCIWNLEPTEEMVASLQSCGVTALEPGAPFLTGNDEDTIAAVGQWCRSAGIRVYVCHTPFGGEYDLSLTDEEARQQAVAGVAQSITRSALMGAECVVVHPSSGGVTPETREHRHAQLARSLEDLLVTAERSRVRLALENMLPNHLGDTSDEVLELVESLDSHWLGVCLDTGHAHLNPEGVINAFQTLKERIIAFHLQDNDRNHDCHLQPPYGTIDWDRFAQVCCADDFPFPWSVEAGAWNGAGWDVLLREMSALFAGQWMAVPWQGRSVRILCQRCGRYGFGTPEHWACGCGEFGAE